jgi:histidinol-phosphate aminotransferase
MDFTSLIREDLRGLKPYLPDRYRIDSDRPVWVDANENPFEGKWGRYPDPTHKKLRRKIGELRNISAENVFVSHGSDEAIDLIIRTFCMPCQDAISILNPVFEMYAHAAHIASVKVNTFSMKAPYQPGLELANQILVIPSKVLFLCSPNNPTGGSLPIEFVQHLLNHWKGMLVIDEAYIDFSDKESFLYTIQNHPNLIVLQTFSKAFGLAGLRIGMTFAQKWVVDILEAVKLPYNMSQSSCEIAIQQLENRGLPHDQIKTIKTEKEKMNKALGLFPFVEEVYPSDANFLLVKCSEAMSIYQWLMSAGIYVRLRKDKECENCIRISIGTPIENNQCLHKLSAFQEKFKSETK